jgi:hypothetical protein
MQTNLTTFETQVLAELKESSNGNGHDFGFIEDVKDLKRARGVIASLVKKGWIDVHDAVTTDSGRWTQFTFTDEAREHLKLDDEAAVDPPAAAFVESETVRELANSGTAIGDLLNIIEALHPIHLNDSRLGNIDMPRRIAEARAELANAIAAIKIVALNAKGGN